jgi:Rps23 Pro-64 3,4-dihydroxylase Tpa1-like proline 4-hydroxylase
MSALNDIVELYDLIPEDYLDKIYLYGTTIGKWNLQSSSTEFKNKKFLQMDINDNPLTKSIIKILETHLNKKFHLHRCYLNGQFFGIPGAPHVDSIDKHEYTFLLYLNPNWEITWGGQTIFFDKSYDVERKEMITHTQNVKTYYPNKKLSLFFPGNIEHYAECPSKDCDELRISMAFKLMEINKP